LKHRRR